MTKQFGLDNWSEGVQISILQRFCSITSLNDTVKCLNVTTGFLTNNLASSLVSSNNDESSVFDDCHVRMPTKTPYLALSSWVHVWYWVSRLARPSMYWRKATQRSICTSMALELPCGWYEMKPSPSTPDKARSNIVRARKCWCIQLKAVSMRIRLASSSDLGRGSVELVSTHQRARECRRYMLLSVLMLRFDIFTLLSWTSCIGSVDFCYGTCKSCVKRHAIVKEAEDCCYIGSRLLTN